MSILNVNKINPVGGGSTITIAGIASVTSNLSAIDITSTNISVGSSVTTNEFYGDQIKLGDNKKILLGEGNDIEIYHTGAVDMIEGKSLYLIQESQNIILRNLAGDEAYAKFFGNGAVELYHNGTKQVETSTNGLKISAAGKGIDFSAQTATSATGATTTAEILNHYEEGSWTPFFQNVNTPTYSSQYGRYTRVGSLVTLIGQIQVASGLDTSDGSTVNIGGFPFAGNSSAGACLFTFGRYTNLLSDSKLADFTNVRFLGDSVMLLEGNNADISYAECNSSGLLQFSVSYIMNT
tara:strand:+ start:181 stop:1062 length:882 start_codon:yes stop_codon:yes gene_type:complete